MSKHPGVRNHGPTTRTDVRLTERGLLASRNGRRVGWVHLVGRCGAKLEEDVRLSLAPAIQSARTNFTTSPHHACH